MIRSVAPKSRRGPPGRAGGPAARARPRPEEVDAGGGDAGVLDQVEAARGCLDRVDRQVVVLHRATAPTGSASRHRRRQPPCPPRRRWPPPTASSPPTTCCASPSQPAGIRRVPSPGRLPGRAPPHGRRRPSRPRAPRRPPRAAAWVGGRPGGGTPGGVVERPAGPAVDRADEAGQVERLVERRRASSGRRRTPAPARRRPGAGSPPGAPSMKRATTARPGGDRGERARLRRVDRHAQQVVRQPGASASGWTSRIAPGGAGRGRADQRVRGRGQRAPEGVRVKASGSVTTSVPPAAHPGGEPVGERRRRACRRAAARWSAPPPGAPARRPGGCRRRS